MQYVKDNAKNCQALEASCYEKHIDAYIVFEVKKNATG